MGDSDESWSGGDESNSSEASESSEAETSDTDEDVKYTTYPTRGVRWRIGDRSQSCTIYLHHALQVVQGDPRDGRRSPIQRKSASCGGKERFIRKCFVCNKE